MAREEIQIYDIIEKKAGSNIAVQGISGLLGFPFTIMTDVAVFFTHYGPMLNEIRAVYGRPDVSADVFLPIFKGSKQELLADMLLDKVIGNIPVISLPANMICAKAMTWRLGILFGMLAARGEEINQGNVETAVRLIRELFPQRESILFKKPAAATVEKLLNIVEGVTVDDFNDKLKRILDAMAS